MLRSWFLGGLCLGDVSGEEVGCLEGDAGGDEAPSCLKRGWLVLDEAVEDEEAGENRG